MLEGDELAGVRLVLVDRLLVRIDDDDAAIAVDDDLIAAADDLGQVLEGDDGRNAQRTGHDGGVAGPPAGVGGHPFDVIPVEAGRLGGAQLPRHDDDLLSQVQDVFPLGPEQLPEQTPLDVVDVRGPLADVGVLDVRLEVGRDLPQHRGDGILGRHGLRLDHVGDPAPQAPVPQEAQVHGEDILDVPAGRLILPPLERIQLVNGLLKGVADALDLRGPLGGLNFPPWDSVILRIHDERFTDRYPRRDRNSLFDLHAGFVSSQDVPGVLRVRRPTHP